MSDGYDFAPAILRALAASNRIVFPERPDGYHISSDVEFSLRDDTIIDVNGQTLFFSRGSLQLRAPTIGSTRKLSAAAPRYASSVWLNDTRGIEKGDLLAITSGVRPSPQWEDAMTDCIPVRQVTGRRIELETPLNFSWLLHETPHEITVFRPRSLSIRRPNLLSLQADAAQEPRRMIVCSGLRNIEVTLPQIFGILPFSTINNLSRQGIIFYYCHDIHIISPRYRAMSYPIGIYGGSRNCREENSYASYCHHSHADMGGYSSDYRLRGLSDFGSYQALSTHICFRAHAEYFDIRHNTSLSNWRCIGGSLKDGYIHTLADDSEPLPQFQNSILRKEYDYLYDDADFIINNVAFDTPRLRDRASFSVRFGRTLYASGVRTNATSLTFGDEREAPTVELGQGNLLGFYP